MPDPRRQRRHRLHSLVGSDLVLLIANLVVSVPVGIDDAIEEMPAGQARPDDGDTNGADAA